jgi:hypothetical protein
MTVHSTAIRDTLLEAVLPQVRDKGWSWEDVTEIARICGYQDDMASSMFPGGLPDVVAHYADYVDRRMLAGLEDTPSPSLRIRERIRLAVLTRLAIVEHQKEEVRKKPRVLERCQRGLFMGSGCFTELRTAFGTGQGIPQPITTVIPKGGFFPRF